MKRLMIVAGVVAALCGLQGCVNENWNVKRHDPKEVRDLDYRFDEDDAREVANAMIAECLSRPWIDRWEASHNGQRPLIVVGNVANNTQDYINSELFTDPLQKELLNSGRVRVKAQKDLRQELRDERLDTKFNDPATVKAIAKEVNADYMLIGRVADNKEHSADGRAVISYYKVTLELIDIETAEKAWIADHDIEKTAVK